MARWTEKQFKDFERTALDLSNKRTGRLKIPIPIAAPSPTVKETASFDKFTFHIDPCPKPRQTRSDKWNKRPIVVKYREFADELRKQAKKMDYVLGETLNIEFHLAMPDSWGKKKRAQMDGQPHLQRPDLDNLVKAWQDSLAKQDCTIHTISMKKVWAEQGKIVVYSHNL